MKVSLPATSMASLIASTASLSLSPSTKTKQKMTESHRHNHPSRTSILEAHQPVVAVPYEIASREAICTADISDDQGMDPATISTTKLSLKQSKSQQQGHRSSVMVPASCDYAINLEAWSHVSSAISDNRGMNLEIRVEWEPGDDLLQVARYAIGETNQWFIDGRNLKLYPSARLMNLVSSMKAFVDICESNLHHIQGYRLKLAAMCGETATRCPLWHIDNVPIRWIQTMVGPGTSYVDDNSETNPHLQRVRYPDRELETRAGNNNPHWKDVLVEKSGARIQQAAVGEPIVLPGCLWPASSKQQGTKNDSRFLPVIHRSPHNVQKNEGRVLLNLDVICGEHKCDCC